MAYTFSSLAGFLGDIGSFAAALPGTFDERLGALAPVVAGAATALAVAIAMAVYFRSGYRSSRDILRHGVATVVVIALLAFAISDIRHAAFSYLGLNPAKPAVEFEIRMPKATVFATLPAETQVELHTDKNQALARLDQVFAATDDGRNVLRGSVRLDFRSSDRVVLLNLPGEKQRLFKLRLAASPSASSQFSPWHLADRVASADRTDAAPGSANDAFAIRYRVM
jgi:hypothetical protein